MRCYLVRHAQTTWNAENRIQGHANPPLSAVGLAQAQRVGAWFATRPIAALYTSHLLRSRQTAEAITRRTGRSAAIHEGLAEIQLGRWEGMMPEEVEAQFPGLFEEWRQSPSRVRIPEAEPYEMFRRRILEAFASIAARHRPEDEIVIVSHGGVISTLLAEWLEANYDCVLHRLALDNASISLADFHLHPPKVLGINVTHHLEDGVNGAVEGAGSSVESR